MSVLPQQYLHTLRLGLECGPKQWREACVVPGVDLCTQIEKGVTHARLITEDGIHERGAASVVSVVNPILNGLYTHTHTHTQQ